MKNIIALTIGAVAVLGLSACTKTETNNTSVTINDTASNETLADNVSETTNTGNTAGDSSNDK